MKRAPTFAVVAGLALVLAGAEVSFLQTPRATAPVKDIVARSAVESQAEPSPRAQSRAPVRRGARGGVLGTPSVLAASRGAPSAADAPINSKDVRTASMPEGPPAGWDAEEPDSEATDHWTRYFAEAMSELEVDGAVDGLTCRKTLCRVNVHFSSFEQAVKFESAAGLVERRRSLNFTVTDGVIDVEVFLARE